MGDRPLNPPRVLEEIDPGNEPPSFVDPIDELLNLSPVLTPSLDSLPSHVPARPRQASRGRSSARPRSRKPRTNKATWLYRYFDADGVALYIGITGDLERRLDDHARSSSWLDFAVETKLERYAKRKDAEEAEVKAIRAERPLFNLAHNDEPGAERRLVDYLIEHDRRDLLRASVSRG